MPDLLRVGIAGIRHSHTATLVRQWREIPDVEIVAAADTFESARRLAHDTWGIPTVYETWEELLEREQLDVVTSTLPNTQHAEVVEVVAGVGLPILIEKPMAASLEDAERMVRAVETADIPAMVNWPNLSDLAIEAGQAIINKGAIGRPHQFTFRGGNSIATRKADQPDWFQWLFEANEGGGSWIDYAGYGATPCIMWMGTPKRMVARGSTMLDADARADETATAILEFETGIGYMQTSHIQVGYAGPQGKMMHIEINGDEGTLVLTPSQTDSKASAATSLMIYDNGRRVEGSRIPLEHRSPNHQSGVEFMAHAIRTKRPIEGRGSFRFNRDVVSVIDAGSRAIASDAWVTVAPSIRG
ncbi:MAG: hypothetical protein CL790_07080 [Chloroflexi bacterium]|nr:hypothetical protein [Chloroflexota bacterium]HCU72876.1 hypothetical protein [Chloroflexota bacterium]|tara:strand:- start:127 stop:1200 length:1074 start_codon:yes stop_codon:yes gene_type:complete